MRAAPRIPLAIAGLVLMAWLAWTIIQVTRADALAETDPQAALRIDPDHPQALLRLAWRQLGNDQIDEAMATARHLLSVEPGQGDAFAVLALRGQVGLPVGTGLFGQLSPVMPAFDWKAAISLALPLYLVTLASQDLSQFALHARAILGLPVPVIRQFGPSASCAMLATGFGVPRFSNLDIALTLADTQLRLFGKPRVEGSRRVGVVVARGEDIEDARGRARAAAEAIDIQLDPLPLV